MTADMQNLIAAAAALLEKIDNITTEDFSRGEERVEREALRSLIDGLTGASNQA